MLRKGMVSEGLAVQAQETVANPAPSIHRFGEGFVEGAIQTAQITPDKPSQESSAQNAGRL
jgi:hypothetical protein